LNKEELDITWDALKDSKAAYRLRQAFIRLSEVGGRTEFQEEELEKIRRKVWDLKKSIAGEEDQHPFTADKSVERIEEKLY
jgi:N-acyl-D-aspartate/D-glutamate deacylase